MKHLSRHIAILIAAVLTITGCSDGDVPDNIPELHDATVYFNINVDIKGNDATRSNTSGEDTSSDGTETGTEAENKINRALLVLRPKAEKDADKPNLFVAVNTFSQNSEGNYVLTAKMPMKDAVEFGKQANGTDYEVFILANHTNSAYASLMQNDYKLEDYKYSVDGLDSSLLNAEFGLPMANFSPCEIKIENWNEETFHDYIEEDNPFPILGESGCVIIERSVARIDYRDKNRTTVSDENDPEKTAYTYKIGETGYVVKLTGMCPINVSKEFFAFRHIFNPASEDAQPSTEFLGREIPTNFFLDTDDATKRGGISALPTDHFINQGAYNTTSHSGYETIFDATDRNKYPYKDDKDDSERHKGYTPWCYITENTITQPDCQLQGLTTGVMFRFEITNAPEDAPVDKKVGNYLDYYYFIRHNDNGNTDEMGPMEFGIVRNNIYKLSVESISGFPDPYVPDNPDEPGDAQMNINVSVNDWSKIHFETDY